MPKNSVASVKPRNVSSKRKCPLSLTLTRLESKLYTEQHTKKVLEEEKKKLNSELAGLRGANAKTDREIRQAKTFTSKKDEEHRKLKEEQEKAQETLTKANDAIVNKSLKLDFDTRRHNPQDDAYVDSYAAKLEDAKAEKSMVDIDKNIA